jgi:hypothetical protein
MNVPCKWPRGKVNFLAGVITAILEDLELT